MTIKRQIYSEYGNLAESDPWLFYQKHQERAVQIIKENPVLFLKEVFAGIADMYFSIERHSFERMAGIKSEAFDAIDIVLQQGLFKALKMTVSKYNFATLL